MRKVITILLTLFLFTSMSSVVQAAEQSTISDKGKDVLFIVKVDNSIEEEKFLKQLEQHNQNSQALWEKALEKSVDGFVGEIIQESSPSILSDISPLAVGQTVNTVSSKKIQTPSGLAAYLAAYVSYTKTNNTFGVIHNVTLYANSSGTTVSNAVINYTRIDGGRTLACGSSALVGVKFSSGNISYYPITSYFEFYASSSGGYWWSNEVHNN